MVELFFFPHTTSRKRNQTHLRPEGLEIPTVIGWSESESGHVKGDAEVYDLNQFSNFRMLQREVSC
jgi:hypothetical protein